MSWCTLFKCCCCCHHEAPLQEDTLYPEFSYETLSADAYQRNHDYESHSDSEGAIHLERKPVNPDTQFSANDSKKVGWKLHIGVHANSLPLAWNLVKNVMINHGISHCKVMRQNRAIAAQSAEGAAGREISIYAFSEPENRADWYEIVQEIESKLAAEGIVAMHSPACAILPTRYHYVSYRCDQGESPNDFSEKNYLRHDDEAVRTAEQQWKHNPYHYPEPAFLLTLKHQLERPCSPCMQYC